jgi:hypothetical protein
MPQQQHSHSMLSEASYHNMTVGRIPSVEGGIQPTIFDAKANLLTATANDTPAILAVGANDTVLTADSAQATGLKWASIPAPTYTWATYTPSNSGITVGNGTQTARFVKVGKTVFVSYKLTLGSTSSLTGGISVGLPSTTNSITTCSVFIQDTGTANYLGTGFADASATALTVRPVKTSTTYGELNDNLSAMFAWTTNDFFQFFVTYEEA